MESGTCMRHERRAEHRFAMAALSPRAGPGMAGSGWTDLYLVDGRCHVNRGGSDRDGAELSMRP
jgi:hypothetical protein